MSSLMVSDFTPQAYSIPRFFSTSSYSLLKDDPTPGGPLNRVYPLRNTLERFILLHSKHIFFLPQCFQSVAASTQSVICQTLNF